MYWNKVVWRMRKFKSVHSILMSRHLFSLSLWRVIQKDNGSRQINLKLFTCIGWNLWFKKINKFSNNKIIINYLIEFFYMLLVVYKNIWSKEKSFLPMTYFRGLQTMLRGELSGALRRCGHLTKKNVTTSKQINK